jgi:hypothetical protein
MSETLQEVEEEIRQVKADIQDIKNAQRARGTPYTETEEVLLVSYNQQLAELRKEKYALRAAHQGNLSLCTL